MKNLSSILTNKEIQRYNRHIILPEIGMKGQEKLKNAKILVVGAGGLGSPVLSYLTAAGIGKIGIADSDTVSLNNLQRQILFSSEQINETKTKAAKKNLAALNPNTEFELFNEKFTKINGQKILQKYDLVVDCTDNFMARYDIDYHCNLQNKAMIYGSISKFTGQISVFHYKNAKSYKDLFPEPPEIDEKDKSRLGVVGILPGIVGSLQANEVFKIITGIGNILAGKLLLIDILKPEFLIVDV